MEDLDPLAVLIQKCVTNGLQQDHIFYRLVSNACQFALDGSDPRKQFQWDTHVKEFINSLETVGSTSVVNLLRGPGPPREKNEAYKFSWDHVNVPLPSKFCRSKLQPMVVSAKGVIHHLLMNFIKIAQESTPLVTNNLVHVVPVCMSRDAMAIKPGGLIDYNKKEIVGLEKKIDVRYVKEHPKPGPDELKFFTEAGAVILTTLDNGTSLLVGSDYLTKSTSGDAVFCFIKDCVVKIQCCLACLDRTPKSGSGILEGIPDCKSSCMECSKNILDGIWGPCVNCAGRGQPSAYPSLKACHHCLEKGIQCVKIVVLVWASDSESNNRKAMKSIKEAKESGEIDENLALLNACPDVVHIGKKLHRSLANWWLWAGSCRFNLIILRILRNDADPEVRKLARSLLSAKCVLQKDRMDFNLVLEACQPGVIDLLRDVHMVTATLLPEPYWIWQGNVKGIVQRPVSVAVGPFGTILVLDQGQAQNKGRLLKARLHYPANVEVIAENLQSPLDVHYMNGTAFVTETRGICYCDLSNKATISPKRMGKRELFAFADEKGIIPNDAQLADYTCPVLRQKLQRWIEDHQEQIPQVPPMPQELQREDSDVNNGVGKKRRDKKMSAVRLKIVNAQIQNPKVLASCLDLLFAANNKSVYELTISSNGIAFQATARRIVDLPMNCIPHGLAYHENCLYVADSNEESGGITKFCLDGTAPQKVITNNQCAVAHGLAFDGPNLIFSDRKRNLVKQLTPSGEVTVISGNGELKTASGKATSSSHAQPTGLATEGHTVYVCDTGSQTLRIITPTTALASYLENIQKMFQVFSVHSDKTKHGYTKDVGLDEVIANMVQVQQYFNEIVSSIREHVHKPTLNPEGPHGSPAYITVEAVTWVTDTLKELNYLFSNIVDEREPDLIADYKQAFRSLSILTLVVEHFFSTMRGRYAMPYMLQYAQLLMPTIQETVKRMTNASFIYFTRKKAHYPDPTASVRYANLKWPVKPPTAPITSEDLQELQEWQSRYCGGVRQRSVRDISKYDAGTLPAFANAEETNQAEVLSSRMHFEGEQCGEENAVESVNEEHHPVEVLFQKGVFLVVKPGYEMFAPDDIPRASFYLTMTDSDVFVDPSETDINVLWYSFTETTDDQFGCFVAVGTGRVLKKGILFALSDTDITTRDNDDIIHLTDTCYSRILNSLNPQTPTASAAAEFAESESQEFNQLQRESSVESQHVEYIDIERTEIRSRRERCVRKRRNEDMVYY